MGTLADYGIRLVTDPARIAAANERLRDISAPYAISLEEAVMVTRGMDAEGVRGSRRRPSEVLAFTAAFAVLTLVAAKLFRSATPAAAPDSGTAATADEATSAATEPQRDLETQAGW